MEKVRQKDLIKMCVKLAIENFLLIQIEFGDGVTKFLDLGDGDIVREPTLDELKDLLKELE